MALAKIVYASMTGNTEEIADIVAKKLEELGHTVDVDECTDEIVDFYEDLADLDLSGKIFGVVGSGDTFYDYFCKSVDEFENQFTFTGATKGADSVKVDLSAEDEDIENLEAFAEKISEALA